jgi:hypothetical protein
LALLSTSRPARANAASTSPATAASSAEKTMGALTSFGSQGSTVTSRTFSGIPLPPIQRVASA